MSPNSNIKSDDSSSWEALQRRLDASFLQTEMWEKFQQAMGSKVHKLSGGGWSCLLIEKRSKLGSYLFAPYGPTLSGQEILPKALAEISNYGRRLGVNWLRLEPCLGLAVNSDLSDSLQNLKLKSFKAPKQVNPLLTRIIDIGPEIPEILAGFSQTARRNIRKNENDGSVSFKTSSDPQDIKLFLEMIKVVSSRNRVYFHSDEYFIKQAEALMPGGSMWLEFAMAGGKPIACIVMHGFNKVATYTYAASLPEARNLNASALVLWQAILNARNRAITRLDLFGVAPDDAGPSHPWYGFSAFKRQFGGTVIRRGETLDVPLNFVYNINRSLVKLRRLLP